MAGDVLVCIEDRDLREVFLFILRSEGHRAWPTANETGALRALATRPIALLLLDGSMPLTEPSLRWVDRHAPDIPAVILGEHLGPVLESARPDVRVVLLPLSRTVLARSIEAVVDAHASRRHASGGPPPTDAM